MVRIREFGRGNLNAHLTAHDCEAQQTSPRLRTSTRGACVSMSIQTAGDLFYALAGLVTASLGQRACASDGSTPAFGSPRKQIERIYSSCPEANFPNTLDRYQVLAPPKTMDGYTSQSPLVG